MTSGGDPFRHHSTLKALIVDPLVSIYRDFDLAKLDEIVRASGAPDDWHHSDAHREETRRRTLDGRLHEDLWVFAYGSLIWDPGFRFAEVRTALLRGYHRSFCLQSVLGRGSPEHPGLMAALDEGGDCRGLAFRIQAEDVEAETRILWRREMLLHAYRPSFVPLETDHGAVEALTFVIDRSAQNYRPNLSEEETAHFMASGVGHFGSSMAYLENLVEHFETMGIEDDALFRLHALARQKAEG